MHDLIWRNSQRNDRKRKTGCQTNESERQPKSDDSGKTNAEPGGSDSDPLLPVMRAEGTGRLKGM